MKRIGLLTSGGDCQALNATLRGVAKGLYNIYGNEVELIGFIDGYKGLMYEDYRKLSPSWVPAVCPSRRSASRIPTVWTRWRP